MKRFNRQKGAYGEDVAVQYLENRGYRIVQRNFRCPLGEIDLVAMEGKYLVFIEVKCRTSRRFGHPAEAVDSRKQRRLGRLAHYFLKKYDLHGHACRFDVVSLLPNKSGWSVELFQNAFPVYEGW